MCLRKEGVAQKGTVAQFRPLSECARVPHSLKLIESQAVGAEGKLRE